MSTPTPPIVDPSQHHPGPLSELEVELLRAQALVATELLESTPLDPRIAQALARLGTAARVSRVYVFIVEDDGQGSDCISQRYEWVAPGVEAQIDNPDLQRMPWRVLGFGRWPRLLGAGEVLSGKVSEFPMDEREVLRAQQILSMVVVPIFILDRLWGFIGFDDCESERDWQPSEIAPLASSARALGTALHREQVAAALGASEARFRLLAENTDDLICLHRTDGRFVYASPSWQRLLGYAPDSLPGLDPYELIHPADRSLVLEQLHQPVLDGSELTSLEFRLRHADGHWIWLETRVRGVPGADARSMLLVSSSRDVSRRRAIEHQLARQKREAETTLRSIADGVVSVDADGLVEYMNPAAERLTGWNLARARGQRAERVLLPDADALSAMPDFLSTPLPQRLLGLDGQLLSLVAQDGSTLHVQISAALRSAEASADDGVVLAFRDVSEAHNLASELAWRASHDSLTGLANRAEFDRRLATAREDARQAGRVHALLYLDLDQFKVVNDTCGHAAGDQLIRQLPATLREYCQPGDCLARLGGDEFGLVLMNVGGEQAVLRAERMLDALRRFRFAWGERNFQIGGSIGVVEIGPGAESAERLMVAADSACYVAKQRGRGRVQLYAQGDAEVSRLHDDLHWLGRLETALDLDDFRLLGQEIRASREPQGGPARYFEVLLALPDALGGLLSPASFLPAAQRYGLMGRIDRWVVSHVVEPLRARERQQLPAFELVSVNLSGSSLGDEHFIDFIDRQVQLLAQPAQLCFELTETEAVANLDRAAELLRRLRARGCRFALDDFGSGLSSFGYLKSLPVDLLKIDGQFVRDCVNDRSDLAMVEAIHRVGTVMGLQTVAEFVETEAIRQQMLEVGVDFLQGYHLGRPQPLENFGL